MISSRRSLVSTSRNSKAADADLAGECEDAGLAAGVAGDGRRCHDVHRHPRQRCGTSRPSAGSVRITKREIAAFVDSEALRAPIGANRTLSIIKTMFKWAVRRDIIEANPAADVSAPSPQKSRERVLNDDELSARGELQRRSGGLSVHG